MGGALERLEARIQALRLPLQPHRSSCLEPRSRYPPPWVRWATAHAPRLLILPRWPAIGAVSPVAGSAPTQAAVSRSLRAHPRPPRQEPPRPRHHHQRRQQRLQAREHSARHGDARRVGPRGIAREAPQPLTGTLPRSDRAAEGDWGEKPVHRGPDDFYLPVTAQGFLPGAIATLLRPANRVAGAKNSHRRGAWMARPPFELMKAKSCRVTGGPAARQNCSS